METKVKKNNEVGVIKIDIRNSNSIKRIEEFNKRWNITNISKDKDGLKNRCLNIIDDVLDNIPNCNNQYMAIQQMCKDVIHQLGFGITEDLPDHFNESNLYSILSKMNMGNQEEYYKFIFALETIINHEYYFPYVNVEFMVKKIAEAFRLSNFNLIIYKNNGVYEIYPIDTEFLNETLVEDVLSWLDEYSQSKKHFSLALKEKRIPEKYRYIVDNLRLSLEMFFKQLFMNQKSLENQVSNIGNYLKDNGISPDINSMYVKLIDYYCYYNNRSAKHNDKVVNLEIDYIIYLTGSFMRLMIQIEKNKQKV